MRTTVICAVWHRDPRRAALIAGHAANLDAQSVGVERIYVFDGGDAAPPGLRGQAVALPDPVTVYQAWNAALAQVRTPLVMNLNLDDRLAPDAVAWLERAVDADAGADLVGGDWRVCHSQETTDAVVPCAPIADLPFVPGWPPVAGVVTRLGSAGERGTRGPACLWRTALHQQVGRYPSAFGDGTPIRVIGDAAWWSLLGQRGRRLARLPVIIGNYHSHPSEQAEFRDDAAAEHATLRRVGLAR